MSITGYEDTDYEILLLLDDLDLENLCYSSEQMHKVCENSYLWYRKILKLYPDFPQILANYEYNALYYKLKYDQWTDIIVWADIHNPQLLKWAMGQPNYKSFFVKSVQKILNSNMVGNYSQQRTNAIKMYQFLYTHRQMLKTMPKLFDMIMYKLKELSDTAPSMKELFDLYVKFFKE